MPTPSFGPKIKLVPAGEADRDVIQAMGRFYVYDISEYTGGVFTEDLRFVPHLEKDMNVIAFSTATLANA